MKSLSSPRLRRRLTWLLALGVLAGGIATLVALIPDTSVAPVQTLPAPPAGQDVQVAQVTPKPRHLTAADRKAIDATLDVVVGSGVRRRNIGASYDFVTKALRGGMTRAQWSRGDIPIYPYPAAGNFHGWTLSFADSDEVDVDLILHPRRGTQVGPLLFNVTLKEVHGRWLVDSFLPGATFAPLNAAPKVRAAADFMARPPGEGAGSAGPRRIGRRWIFAPFVAFGLFIAGLTGWGLVGWYRQRRVDRGHSHELPPSPLSIRADGAGTRPSHRS